MIKNRALNTLTGQFVVIFHYLYCLLFYKRYVFDEVISDEKPAIIATWHQHIWLLLAMRRPRKIMALVSQSQDGDVIIRLLKSKGWLVVRGSSSRGGREALKELRKIHKEKSDYSILVTVDGPRGPSKKSKRGVFEISKLTGLPIVDNNYFIT